MSYEGFELWYCPQGHFLGHHDAHEYYGHDYDINPESENCSVCGQINQKNVLIDYIDQTNGCFCDELDYDEKPCSAHPSVTEVIGYDFRECPICEGTGEIRVPTWYIPINCSCGKDPICPICFGTGHERKPGGIVKIACEKCKTTGKVPVERWNIECLKRND